MPKVKDTEYLFATARVRSVERSLLSMERVDKMLDAKNPEDALKILLDCGFGEGNAELPASAFEELLSQERKKTNEFIRSISPEPEVFDMFLYTYDYHNLKTILKAEYQEISPDDYLSDAGSIPLQRMKSIVRERAYSDMTGPMGDAFVEILDLFARTADPQVIDMIFDRACFEDMRNSAELSRSDYVKGYVSVLIDTTNLKTFVRLKKMDKNWDFFSKAFIEGGELPKDLFVESFDDTLKNFTDRLAVSRFGYAVTAGVESLEASGKFTEFERLCDNCLLDYVKNAKYVPFGIEPLVGYMAAKDSEIKTARIVMSGKLAGIPSEEIRGRLRETYV